MIIRNKDIDFYLSCQKEIHSLRQVFSGNLPHRVPGGGGPDNDHCHHHIDEIQELDFYGVGIHDIGAFAAAQPEEAEFLLQQGQQSAQEQAQQSAGKGDHHPFRKKYLPDLRFTGTQAPEHGNIFFLVDDQHRQGADHIESRDDQDHSQDKEDGPFFRFHHPVKGSLLLVTVFDFEIARRGLQPVLR